MHYLRPHRPGAGTIVALPLVLFFSVVACAGKSIDGDVAEGGEAGADPASGGNGGSAGNAGRSTGGAAGSQGGFSTAGMAGTATAGSGPAGAGGAVSCVLDGKPYPPGTSFPSPDGCNTCTCIATGEIACTRLACGGNGNGSGGGSSLSCDEVQAELFNELLSIQKCGAPDECGQVLKGTSCGCTRDLVARLDADTTRFNELLSTTVNGEQCASFGSTCDCPEADGFACQNGTCTWNYVDSPECSPAPVGRLCVLGTPIDSGDVLGVGDPLIVRVFPSGCYSSSCTEAVVAECTLKETGQGEFVADAAFCLAQDSSGGCTADCGGGGDADCTLKDALVEGENTIRIGKASLTVTVPGIVAPGDGCVELSDDG